MHKNCLNITEINIDTINIYNNVINALSLYLKHYLVSKDTKILTLILYKLHKLHN